MISDALRVLRSIDLTNLDDGCSGNDVRALCRRAVTAHGAVAAVCVWPHHVGIAHRTLPGSGVAVATVANFPSGDQPLADVVRTVQRALDDGADEIDVVLPYRSFVRGETDSSGALLTGVRSVIDGDRVMKVILETGELGDTESMRRATRLAIDSGADFVKTSTGKTSVSATPVAVGALLAVVHDEFRASGRRVGIKPSGGIRRIDDALVYLGMCDELLGSDWATPSTFRLGASALLDSVIDALDHPH